MTKPKHLLRSLPVLVGLALGALATPAAAANNCFDFSTMPVGATNVVGDLLATPTADVFFDGFTSSTGTFYTNGYTEVDNTNYALGSLFNELIVNNIMVYVDPHNPSDGARLQFADYGGNVNFEVNGDFRNAAKLSDLDGTMVGGALITVTLSSATPEIGELRITPQQQSLAEFGVGGQEFYLDDVCYRW